MLSKFHSARHAGVHNMMGVDPDQQQKNFKQRIQEFESLLRSIVRQAELNFPVNEIQGVYEPGDDYKFYRDLSGLFAASATDVFIVDAYLSEDVFNLYVEKIGAGARIRILSTKLGPNGEAVARKFASGRALELRTSSAIHDRTMFLDGRCWIIGASIKDAAVKKPTYMVEIEEPLLSAARSAYEVLWATAQVVV